jgi:hypothetical protein
MYQLVMKLLPREYRVWIDLVKRMFKNLDTATERQAAIDYFVQAHQSGGQLTVVEWSHFGKLLGVLGNADRKVPGTTRDAR